jgi:predicted ATPase
MIIGLTGAHGTGKSTLLNELNRAGYNVDRSQLSRQAQKSLGWKHLDEVKSSLYNMWKFQFNILDALSERDNAITELTIVDRTPADLWAYTCLWCDHFGINPDEDAQAILYRELCEQLSLRYQLFVVIPIMSDIPFEKQLNRASVNDQKFVEESIFAFMNEINNDQFKLTSPILSERVNAIIPHLKEQ